MSRRKRRALRWFIRSGTRLTTTGLLVSISPRDCQFRRQLRQLCFLIGCVTEASGFLACTSLRDVGDVPVPVPGESAPDLLRQEGCQRRNTCQGAKSGVEGDLPEELGIQQLRADAASQVEQFLVSGHGVGNVQTGPDLGIREHGCALEYGAAIDAAVLLHRGTAGEDRAGAHAATPA